MMQQLEAVEQGAGRAFLAWLAQARVALEVGWREFIARRFESLPDFLDLRRLLPLLSQVDLWELLGPHDARQVLEQPMQASAVARAAPTTLLGPSKTWTHSLSDLCEL
jgi:hypothetical protein